MLVTNILLFDHLQVPGWKKIHKPVWISEWFPTPDHHDHHHDHHHVEEEHHHHHGWDRLDDKSADKVVWKRSEEQQRVQSPGAAAAIAAPSSSVFPNSNAPADLATAASSSLVSAKQVQSPVYVAPQPQQQQPHSINPQSNIGLPK